MPAPWSIWVYLALDLLDHQRLAAMVIDFDGYWNRPIGGTLNQVQLLAFPLLVPEVDERRRLISAGFPSFAFCMEEFVRCNLM